jgi:hypothetical protein
MARPTFSATVSRRNSEMIWKVRTTPRATRRSGEALVMSVPKRRMVPAEGCKMPVIWLTRVVLPAPFGPINAWRAPGSSARFTFCVTLSAPKFLWRPVISSAGTLGPAAFVLMGRDAPCARAS